MMPRSSRRLLLGAPLVLLLCLWGLPDLDLSALASGERFADGCERLGRFFAAFLTPDLSNARLLKCLELAAETLSIALLGVALGTALAWPLAVLASESAWLGIDGDRRAASRWRRVALHGARLLLDVLRGVPDFAWALVLVTLLGISSFACMLAVAVNLAGILGKMFSEQWDRVPPGAYRCVATTGAGRLQTLLFGVQPLAARQMLSFLLMRAECAVRNASVIGVIGGGGLGSAIWDLYADNDYPAIATVFLSLLLLTASADLVANLLRHQLRVDHNHPRLARQLTLAVTNRRRLFSALVVLVLLALSAWRLWPSVVDTWATMQRIDYGFGATYVISLLTPDLSPDALGAAVELSWVPLGTATVSMLLALPLCALLAWSASLAFQIDRPRFTGERSSAPVMLLGWTVLGATRGLALIWRAIPDVAWVLIFLIFFRNGMASAIAALTVHSAGVLLRVFTETVDNIPYRRFEGAIGSATQTYLYRAVPQAWPDWLSYSAFQFEVNVRTGVVLGIVGAGGLGQAFRDNLGAGGHQHRASTYLFAMVLLTTLIDRLSRRMLRRSRRA